MSTRPPPISPAVSTASIERFFDAAERAARRLPWTGEGLLYAVRVEPLGFTGLLRVGPSVDYPSLDIFSSEEALRREEEAEAGLCWTEQLGVSLPPREEADMYWRRAHLGRPALPDHRIPTLHFAPVGLDREPAGEGEVTLTIALLEAWLSGASSSRIEIGGRALTVTLSPSHSRYMKIDTFVERRPRDWETPLAVAAAQVEEDALEAGHDDSYVWWAGLVVRQSGRLDWTAQAVASILVSCLPSAGPQGLIEQRVCRIIGDVARWLERHGHIGQPALRDCLEMADAAERDLRGMLH